MVSDWQVLIVWTVTYQKQLISELFQSLQKLTNTFYRKSALTTCNQVVSKHFPTESFCKHLKVSKESFSKCPKLSIGTFQKQVWVTNYLSYPVQYGGSFRFTKKYSFN